MGLTWWHPNGGSWVYFKRGKNDNNLASTIEGQLGEVETFKKTITIGGVVGNLRAIAAAEQKKEIRLITELFKPFFKNNSDLNQLVNEISQDPINLIIRLNDAISGFQKFRDYINYLQSPAFGGYKANIGRQKRAPGASQYVEQVLARGIVNAVLGFLNGNTQAILDGQITKGQIQAVIQDYINSDQVVEEAISAMEEAYNKQYTTKDIWKSVGNIRNDPRLKSELKSIIGTMYIGKDSIEKLAESIYNQNNLDNRKNEKNLKGKAKKAKLTQASVKKFISKSAKGFVNEIIGSAILGGVGGENITTNVGSAGLSNLAKTDMIQLLQIDGECSINEDAFYSLIDNAVQIDNQFGKNAQELARLQVSQLTQNLDELLDKTANNGTKSFIVYTTAKEYGLMNYDGGAFSGFSSGGDRSIGSLPGILNGLDINFSSSRILNFLINTGEGDILEDQAGELEPYFSSLMASKVAEMLFDDWSAIGNNSNTNADVLHVFYLDGVYMPASSMYGMMADSLNQSSSIEIIGEQLEDFIDFNFNINPALFPSSSDTTSWIIDSGLRQTSRSSIMQKAWGKSLAHGLQSTFNFRFLANFNEILQSIFNKLPGMSGIK